MAMEINPAYLAKNFEFYQAWDRNWDKLQEVDGSSL